MFKTYIFLTIFLLSSCNSDVNDIHEEKKIVKEEVNNFDNDINNHAEKTQGSYAKQTRGFKVEDDDMVFGDKNSDTVFIEYFSPTCPHCIEFHRKIFPRIKEKYIDTGKIAYVMREFIGNKQDLDATILARCSGNLKTYSKFIEVILEQQKSWAFNKKYREILTNIGSLGGVSPELYSKCLKDDNLLKTLTENAKLIAKEPKFLGTPSFFINGKIFSGNYVFKDLSEAIDEVIIDTKRKKTGTSANSE